MGVITLLGYMGSGKSTYGKLVSEKLGFRFVDLDDYITEKVEMSISEIFKSKGEEWFRDVETKSLKSLLKEDNLILSLGGGTPIYNNNMEVVNELSNSIYLNASPSTLHAYLKDNRSKRPIIRDLSESELLDFIENHLGDRKKFYEMAKYSVITDDKGVEEVVDELYRLIKNVS